MANRDQAAQVRQYGKESTAGTAVPADTVAPDLTLVITETGDTNMSVVASGAMYPTDSLPGMYSGKGTYSMPPSYSQLQFIFDSLLKKVTATGSTLAKTRLWSPAAYAIDTKQTYSTESGQTGSVDKFKYVVCNTLKMKISKQDAATPLTGDVLGQYNGVTNALTGSPTRLAASVASKISWDIFSADTFAHLSSAPVANLSVHTVEIDYGPLQTEVAFIDSADPGWNALGVPVAPKNSVKVLVPKDVSGSDYLGAGLFSNAKWQQRTPIYLRCVSKGNFIETVSLVDYYEMIIIDMALRITGPPTEAPVGPFVGQQWPCEITIDSTNKSWEVTTISTQA